MSTPLSVLYVVVVLMVVVYSILIASVIENSATVGVSSPVVGAIAVFSNKHSISSSNTLLPATSPAPEVGTRLTVSGVTAEGVISTAWSASSTSPVESSIVTVQKNSRFSTIQSAVDYVNAQTRSVLNTWTIQVLPGVYDEADLVIPEFTTIQGFSANSEVVIQSDVPDSGYIFKLSDNTYLKTLTLYSTYTGPAEFSGVFCDSAATEAHVVDVTFEALPIGVYLENDGPSDVTLYLQNCVFNFCTTHACEVGNNLGSRVIQLFAHTNTFNCSGDFVSAYHIHSQNTTLDMNSDIARTIGSKPLTDGYFLYVSEGSTLRCSGVTVYDFTIGVYVNNDAGTPSVQMLGANMTGCTSDVQIHNGACTGIISGILDRDTVVVPAGVSVVYSDAIGLGLTLSGNLFQGTTNATSTNVTSMIQEALPLGRLSGGVLSMSGSSVSTTAGTGYISTGGNLVFLQWSAQTYATPMTAYSQMYAYVNASSVLAMGASAPDVTTNVILGIVNTDASANLYYIQDVPRSINNLASGLLTMMDETLGPVFPTGGCVVTNPSALNLAITAGSYYLGNLKFTYTGQASPAAFDTYWYAGSGGMSGWTITTAQTSMPIQYNNTVAGTLVAITDQMYIKHALYISGSGTLTFLVYGSTLFASSSDAVNGVLPSPPSFFVANTVAVASIVVFRDGVSYTVDSIQRITPTLSFVSGQTASNSNHSTLLNLDADTHLQYLPVNGSRPMLGTLDMSTNPVQNITSAGFLGSTSGSTLTVQADAKTTAWTLSLPTSSGTVGQVLQSNGSGNGTSWVTTTSTNASLFKQLSATQTSSSSTLVDVSGLNSISLNASSTYFFTFKGLVQTEAVNTGYLISTNASPAATVNYMYTYWTSNSNSATENVTTLGGGTSTTTSASNGGYVILEGSITTTVPSTFAIRYAVEAGSGHQVSVLAGAFVFLNRIG